ncbi:MAG: hypothetical protein ACOX0K_09575 [Oscillospiraceae bacterium]|jgi:hypothetical protein
MRKSGQVVKENEKGNAVHFQKHRTIMICYFEGIISRLALSTCEKHSRITGEGR